MRAHSNSKPEKGRGQEWGSQLVAFLGHAIDLYCPSFVPLSSVPKARSYARVERRESANVAEPWETRLDRTKSPNGAAVTGKFLYA